ncbi:tagatose-6-phosphate kinase [Streptococcus pseudoporcinus]|uniref:Tagatose-6-phosphate kinase n=1 Tax=Streptococcus pseudoporcinus TaxID=361101 RepID=A0A4U9XPZ0_9STRE|nr:tagatose-6-phosphate kinase [Streptococcus pseudoporcinus]VTS15544.1 tagatose-6-phosphate kinase [Streptococcus pseudoporcinus]
MILTVTLNPSIDISYPLASSFKLDTINRASITRKTAGGKGLNVSRVLAEAGQEIIATGFIGGLQGQYLLEQLEKQNIDSRFFHIKNETRNCIAILHDGLQTEILERGPYIDLDEAYGFIYHMQIICPQCQVMTISGSLPQGLDKTYYHRLISMANTFRKKVVLDCSGAPLEAILRSAEKPTVIKPNIEELALLLGRKMEVRDTFLKEALKNELFKGIEWVIVSLGGQGAFAKHHDKFYRVTIPKVSVINPVGSGDAAVAGIAWALAGEDDAINLLKKANTLGVLNAQEVLTGHVDMRHYSDIFNQIIVEEV